MSKKKEKLLVRGKRKEAIARVTIEPGKGVIRINSFLLDAWVGNEYIKEMIKTPLSIAESVLPGISEEIDIKVNVKGGGIMGQADAIRLGIARALLAYVQEKNPEKVEELKKTFLSYDRALLVEDPRRVEPKKPLGPKARARFQKSYR